MHEKLRVEMEEEMTEEAKENWLSQAEYWFDFPVDHSAAEHEARVWRCLLRWASGLNFWA